MSAVGTGDTVAVQAIAALFVAIFLLTDLLATLFNPRLRGVPPGESTRWILRREVLPNIAAPLIGAFSRYLTSGIVSSRR